jgi:uncharacterized protein YqgQ
MRQGIEINSFQDVRLLLKRYGTFIYTGDRLADLDLMEDEIRELHENKFIEPTEFQKALLLIKQEQTKLE